jgi:hypothetical protein
MELLAPRVQTAVIAGALAATADCSGVTAASAARVVMPKGLVRVVATAAWAAKAARYPVTVAPVAPVELVQMELTDQMTATRPRAMQEAMPVMAVMAASRAVPDGQVSVVTLGRRAMVAMADRASMVPMVSMAPRLVKPAALAPTVLSGVLGARVALVAMADQAEIMALTQSAATVVRAAKADLVERAAMAQRVLLR